MAVDRQSAYSISLFGSQRDDNAPDSVSPSRIQQALVDFVMEFHLDNIFVYRYATPHSLYEVY
jgi:DNA replication licensing factor MCM5